MPSDGIPGEDSSGSSGFWVVFFLLLTVVVIAVLVKKYGKQCVEKYQNTDYRTFYPAGTTVGGNTNPFLCC